MSTFSGFFPEIPGISADRFLEVNRSESRVFFLSHCHMDHMQGLQLPDPLPGPLYTSPISAVFLRHRFPQVVENVRPIEIGETLSIQLNSTELHVTAIPAGHCPGSIMFLFENDHKSLYTGDFRLSPKDLRNILPLRDLTPDIVYLDTTFFLRQYRYFPPQSESLTKIASLSQEWLALNPQNAITIKLPALYGSEFLFMELSRSLGQKIHVKREELQSYRFLASLDDVVTADGASDTRIHACDRHGKLACRPELDGKFIRVIRPSALRWRGLKPGDAIWRRLGGDINREEFSVCYSNHASYDELEDFLRYLRPKAVRLNVVWKDDPGGAQMKGLLKEVCPWIGREEGADKSVGSSSGEALKFDGIVYQRKGSMRRRRSQQKLFSDEESGDEEAAIEHLPKRVR
ncbi:protein artemis-like [Ochlerotatus camptorhynchus]|uniref:protein artemis-like n=1 Tax=Ochlerotatus camptorhynchus TaxID=644619 RepID=UPI0031D2FD00